MTLELGSESALLKVEVERSQGHYILSVAGELDLVGAPLLRERLSEAAQSGAYEVVVDLESATFIDSTGLGVLVSAHKRLAAEGSELIIRSPSTRAMNLFKITGLLGYLNLKP